MRVLLHLLIAYFFLKYSFLREIFLREKAVTKNYIQQKASISKTKYLSPSGLGVAPKQHTNECRLAMSYASRFLNSQEEKNLANELELLEVVWSIKHFTLYRHHTPLSFNQCLKSEQKASQKLVKIGSQDGSTQKNSFKFDIEHLAGKKMV